MSKKDLDHANSRGVGQFHCVDAQGRYTGSTWRSFEVAKAIAAKNGDYLFNDSGECVAKP